MDLIQPSIIFSSNLFVISVSIKPGAITLLLIFLEPNSWAKDLENPIMPDRTQWLNDYAWTEYTVDEIATGMPLKRLTNYL